MLMKSRLSFLLLVVAAVASGVYFLFVNKSNVSKELPKEVCRATGFYDSTVFTCRSNAWNASYKVVPAATVADAPTVFFDGQGNTLGQCGGLQPFSARPITAVCQHAEEIQCTRKVSCPATSSR